MWPRQTTLNIGIDQKQFTKAFIKALHHDEVVKRIQQAICGDLHKEIKDLTDIVKAKDAKITSLEKQVVNLEAKIEDLEQYSRRNSLRIYGIKENEKENSLDMALNLFQSKMGLDLQASNIDRVHRVGRKENDKKTRPLLVKFATYQARDSVFRAKSRLKSAETRGIFVNEDLTRQRAQLFYNARQLKKTGKIADCWTYDGKILLKTVRGLIKPVNNQEELNGVVD